MSQKESIANYRTGKFNESISSKVRNTIARLRPIDDVMFKKISVKEGVCSEIIRTVLDNQTIEVVHSTSQAYMPGIQREAVLDNLSVTTDGWYVNIDIQRNTGNDDMRRTRFHESIITVNATKKGSSYKDVPTVIIIYISEYDATGSHQLKTIVERMYKKGDKYVKIDDGQQIIYINATVRDNSLLSEMMEIFLSNNEVHNSNFPKLCEAINFYKRDKKGYDEMCLIIEELLYEVRGELAEELKVELTEELTEELKVELTEELTEELKVELTEELTEELKVELTEELTEKITGEFMGEIHELRKQTNELKDENNELIIKGAHMLINGVNNIIMITGKNVEEACFMQGVTVEEYSEAKKCIANIQ